MTRSGRVAGEESPRFRDINELHKAAVRKIEAARQAAGFTLKDLARECGFSTKTLDALFAGAMPTPEVSERLVKVLFHRQHYRHAPSMPSRFGRGVKLRAVRVRFLPEEWRALNRYAKQTGLSRSAVLYIAWRRFLEDNPPWVAIADVVKAVKAAEAVTLLENNPGLAHLLRSDPEMARLAHEAGDTPSQASSRPYWEVGARKILDEAVEFEQAQAELTEASGPFVPVAEFREEEDDEEE